jgi:hypothetical protein
MPEKNEFLTYKGHPLVRCGNTLYYGSMADKYIVMLKILNTKKSGDLDVADKVSVQLMYTDDEMRAKDRIVKTSEKDGLYNAMDLGAIWLERALREK